MSFNRQRCHRFAQRSFDGRVPARLDLDFLPKARGVFQSKRRQPGRALALRLLHAGLQFGERGGFRFQSVHFAFGVVQRLSRLPQTCFMLRPLGAGGFQVFGQPLGAFLFGFQCDLLLLQGSLVVFRQTFLFLHQAQLARLELLDHLFRMRPVGFFQLRGLFVLTHFALLRGDGGLRGAHRIFRLRQCFAGLSGALGKNFRLLLGLLQFSPVLFAQRQRRLLFGQSLSLAFQVQAYLVAQALARRVQMAQFLFHPGDLAAFGIKAALRLVQVFRGFELGQALAFQFRFQPAQFGGLGLDVGARGIHLACQFGLAGLRLAFAGQRQPLRFQRAVGVEQEKLPRHFRLNAEFFQLAAEFLADIGNAVQVFARIAQSAFGLLAAFLVFRHARRFFQKPAQFLRLGLDDARNHALLNDRVGFAAQAGAEEEIGHIALADLDIVDVIAGIAGPCQNPLDRNLGILRPLSGRLAVAVVEQQFDRSTRSRLAPGRAVEDHVLHTGAAQFARL